MEARPLAFDFGLPPVDPVRVRPCDPHVTADERPRLSAQNAAILARLQRGPASNVELAGLALKYTSRISDLRAAGYEIQNFDRNGKTGESWYRLKP